MYGFLANGYLPRVSRQSRLPDDNVNNEVMHKRTIPSIYLIAEGKPQLGAVRTPCDQSSPQMRTVYNKSGRLDVIVCRKKGRRDRVGLGDGLN